jgi:hypothetical protein
MAEASATAMNSQLNLQMIKKVNKILKHPMFTDMLTTDPPQITSEEAESSGMQDLTNTIIFSHNVSLLPSCLLTCRV